MFVASFDESVHVGSWLRSSFLNVSKGGKNRSELAGEVASRITVPKTVTPRGQKWCDLVRELDSENRDFAPELQGRVTQYESIKSQTAELLTGGLLVRIQPEEPFSFEKSHSDFKQLVLSCIQRGHDSGTACHREPLLTQKSPRNALKQRLQPFRRSIGWMRRSYHGRCDTRVLA